MTSTAPQMLAPRLAPRPEPRADDVLRVLLCTDTHVGCHERNPIRKDDSANVFHEIMGLARKVGLGARGEGLEPWRLSQTAHHTAETTQYDVDFILHGGDLFHENKPSRRTLMKTMKS